MGSKAEDVLRAALRLGYIAPDQATEIYGKCNKDGLSITQILVRGGYLSPQQLAQVVKVASSTYSPKDAGAQPPSTAHRAQEESSPLLDSDLDDLNRKMKNLRSWKDMDILEELGRGGMGIVYKAREKSTGRVVALKLIMTGTEAQSKRFLREARANVQLNHPHILPVYANGQEQSYSYLTMKYIQGMTFSESLTRQEIALDKKLEILSKVCHALQHAHDNNILHRDVKPSNILLDEQNEPYLSDFGLAKFLDQLSSLTQSGQTVGTPFYMSPEQVAAERRNITPATDIYSMGVVLYETLTGQLPFTASAIPALYHKILTETPVPPHVKRPDVPYGASAICLKAMEKLPGLRYASAGDMAQDIENFRSGKPLRALRWEVRRIVYRSYDYLLRYPWLAVGSALLFVLALAITLWAGSGKEWKTQWKAAHREFASAGYLKALEHLDRVRGYPRPKELAEFREKIYERIGTQAEACLQKGDCEGALRHLAAMPHMVVRWEKLRIRVLEKKGQVEEMRLALSRLSELQPSADDLEFMGEMALGRGYFQDAEQYLRRAFDSRPTPSVAESLAQTLQARGKYRESFNYYLKAGEGDPEVAVGIATIHYFRREYGNALSKLEEIETPGSPYLAAQVYFLGACCHWRILESDLTRWHCLRGEETSHLAKLQEIEQELRQASKKLEEISSPTYLESALRRHISLHIDRVRLEQNSGVAAGDVPQELPPETRSFFARVMLRSLIRNGNWQKAEEMCREAIADFPWDAQPYYMRSIARFHLDRISEALVDLEQAIALDRWNFIFVETMSNLMYDVMAQKEYNEYSLNVLNRFVFSSSPSLSRLVLARCLEEAREDMPQDNAAISQKSGDEEWKALLQRTLDTDSAAVFGLLSDILAQRQDRKFESELSRLREQSRYRQKIERILSAVEQRKKRESLSDLERLLLKYAALREEHYVVKVYQMGKGGEESLKEILNDPNRVPLVRFLAAQMLAAIKRETACQALIDMSYNAGYPVNLLAAAALKDSRFSCALPKISPEDLAESRTFFRMLFALYLSPSVNPAMAFVLLADREEIVALCAAYNFRRYTRLPQPLSAEAIEKRMVELLGSRDPYIRALACSVFWNFAEVGIDLLGKERESAQSACRNSCWMRHLKLLEKTLNDPLEKVQFAGVMSILDDTSRTEGELMVVLIPDIVERPDFRECITRVRDIYRNCSYFMRFWCAVVLSTYDDAANVWQMIREESTSSFIRMACARAMFMSKRAQYEDVHKLMVEVLFDKKDPEDKSGLKQSALFVMGWNVWSGWLPKEHRPLAQAIIESNVKDPNSRIRRSAIAALAWAGEARHIPMLRAYLKSDDRHIQRAAAATIAGLTSSYQPQKIGSLLKSLGDAPPHVRKAAAYGLYEPIRREVALSAVGISDLPCDRTYDYYIMYFKHKLNQKDAPGIKIWETVLQGAIELAPCFEYCYEAAVISQHLDKAKTGFLDARSKFQQAMLLAREQEQDNPIHHREAHCLLALGEIYISMGDNDEAAKTFEDLLRLYPFSAKAHFYLGKLAADRKDPLKAREHLWQSCMCDRDLFAGWIKYLREGKDTAEYILQQIR